MRTEHQINCSEYYKRNKETLSAKRRKYYYDNKEAFLLFVKKYKENNTEKISQAYKNWYEKNSERKNNVSGLWHKNNPIKHNLYAQKRRKNVKDTDDQTITYDAVLEKLTKQNQECVYCQKNISNKPEIDHIYPLILGGKHTISNIQLLCQKCNRSKGKKTHEQFLHFLTITKT